LVGLSWEEIFKMKKPDFATFYKSVHGYPPFPWQIRLAQRAASGGWPDALNLPTSSGKTAVVDVWLWAHSVGIAGTPKRLYYVIDRRLLVDAVADYAQDLFARSGVVGQVVRLRGGMGAAEDTWMLNPGGLTVISTTLDQVGSRLLCRAYGSSRWTAPVHAGLVGNDALIVIDEAHLVEPFRQTLQRIARFRLKATEPAFTPWHVLTMTATPLGNAEDVLSLQEDDKAHPLLSCRLSASKQARLVIGKLSDLSAEAERLREGGAGVVGVVVNTVDTARAVHRALSVKGECILIIGRARPIERDALAKEIMARAGTGTRAKSRLPLFVVATQTIEVGLDLDFDALVSELAPVSALRQRFGRLDRLGELGISHASIVKVSAAKWPYAKELLDAAWSWLEAGAVKAGKLGKVADMGIAMQGTAPAEPVLHSVVLGLPDLALLFDPALEIDITPYLHGEKRSTEAFVAWRTALDILAPDEWVDAIETSPPTGLELMPIPLHTLKRWLSGVDSTASDLESTPEPDDFRSRSVPLPVMRWDGESAELVAVSALRTSDIVVLPASRGGCDRFGWHPSSKSEVRDLFEEGLATLPRWSGRNERTRWAIGLADHMAGVGQAAARFAQACGLPAEMIERLDEAGRLHDLGKNDPRFQLMLGAFDGRLLAKSGSHEVAVSRKLAGLPRGWRHELGSVAQRLDIDPLVRYLVGTHHGRGRPWMPATQDPKLWHKAQAGDWPALASQMQERYGFWGLCYLEAILRLADWVRSSEEQAAADLLEQQHAA
jgi:CRISPR-associated endonuclease/helicase Cas3